MNNTIAEIEIKYASKSGKVKIGNSSDAYQVILSNWNQNTIELHEEFKVVLLNRANEVLGVHTVSKGGITATIVDIRLVFAVALKSVATGLILVHNHPSGNLKPSEADKTIFYKIQKASKLLDITIIDNMIISKDDFYSFVDRGMV